MSKKILVTGAKGYIGTMLCHRLELLGHQVIRVDDGRNANLLNHEQYKHVNIVDERALQHVFHGAEIDTVVHLAANKYAKSFTDNVGRGMDLLNENVRGTLNVLQMMEYYGVKNLVFATTRAHGRVYDQPQPKATPGPTYAFSKRLCEDLIMNFTAKNDFNSTMLFLDNVVGCDKASKAIDFPRQSDYLNLLPLVNEALRGKRDQLNVDNFSVRDYVSLTHVVYMFLKAVEEPLGGLRRYGCGKQNVITMSANEMICFVFNMTGRSCVVNAPIQPAREMYSSSSTLTPCNVAEISRPTLLDVEDQFRYYDQIANSQ